MGTGASVRCTSMTEEREDPPLEPSERLRGGMRGHARADDPADRPAADAGGPAPLEGPTRAPPGGGAAAGARDSLPLLLVSPLCSLRPISVASPREIASWFADRVSVRLPQEAQERLDRWEASLRDPGEGAPDVAGWGPARTPADRAGLIAFLRERVAIAQQFTFNALWREPQGGRMYPFLIPSYSGPITISRRQYDKVTGPGQRLLLSAIKRDVRALFEPPPGWALLELDFRSCHPAIGLALSKDEQLRADIRADIHQVVGDAFAARLADPVARRRFGKYVNNAMLFGLTPEGLRDYAQRALQPPPSRAQTTAAWEAWWRRYPELWRFRAQVEECVLSARGVGLAITVVAPSGRTSRFSRAEVIGAPKAGRRGTRDAAAVTRSVFSACFRAVEADLLDHTIRLFRVRGGPGRIVLPLYDGMIVAAPERDVRRVEQELEAAARGAALELGLAELLPSVIRPPGGDQRR